MLQALKAQEMVKSHYIYQGTLKKWRLRLKPFLFSYMELLSAILIIMWILVLSLKTQIKLYMVNSDKFGDLFTIEMTGKHFPIILNESYALLEMCSISHSMT